MAANEEVMSQRIDKLIAEKKGYKDVTEEEFSDETVKDMSPEETAKNNRIGELASNFLEDLKSGKSKKIDTKELDLLLSSLREPSKEVTEFEYFEDVTSEFLEE
jgi:hypothetical protein